MLRRKIRAGFDSGSGRDGKRPAEASRGRVALEPVIFPPLPLPRNYSMLLFTNFCPFSVMRLLNLPRPQRYTRQERYRARPPSILERSGFHTKNSLAIYQGLVYYLLWLHSKYDKVGVGQRAGQAWDPEPAQRARPMERSAVGLESWRTLRGSLRMGPGLSGASKKGCWGCGQVESRVWGRAGVCKFCSGLPRLGGGPGLPLAWELSPRPIPSRCRAIPAAVRGPGARPHLALVAEQPARQGRQSGLGTGPGAAPGHPSLCPHLRR
ncbi:hypothetical protein P7K49_034252 [Saguinus oedipus]|uniref:Uncharacterized protein n=1 Tax=Saguinus oedipus TaxID=9490 RepID=A0ABQ9TV09_SAGOE|nr:hypothetical protein P7K49_034252 [Saguinus oedipus]